MNLQTNTTEPLVDVWGDVKQHNQYEEWHVVPDDSYECELIKQGPAGAEQRLASIYGYLLFQQLLFFFISHQTWL